MFECLDRCLCEHLGKCVERCYCLVMFQCMGGVFVVE